MKLTKNNLKNLPSQPGVYLFYQKNQPLYIGKANNLKARILSHRQNAKYNGKEKAIFDNSDRIETLVTETDFSALLLEAELIKKWRPKYNVRWKDDKKFLYIKITRNKEYPKVFIVRKENDGQSLYFGPFSSQRLVNNLIRELRKITPFCGQKKISKKPCFYSQIGLCNPCPNYITSLKGNKATSLKKLYRSNIKNLIRLLKGKFTVVLTSLEKELIKKIKQGRYEEGLILRNKIKTLKTLTSRRFFDGQDLLTENNHWQIELQLLLNKFWQKQKPTVIKRVECFDISNLSGQQAAGSMVVFTKGAPDKKEYRRFQIKKTQEMGDLAMLKEVLERRFKRKDWALPDLLIVDGGRPQVKAAFNILKQLKLKISLLGIAKSPDRLVIGNNKFQTVYLKENSNLFSLIRYLRDESHRFAKKYHRLLRKKKMMYNQ